MFTLILIAVDKYKAINNYYRISEGYLFTLFLCGGWIGGYIGMIVCNHKLKKLSFVLKSVLMTLCNIVVVNLIYKF